MDDQRNNSLKPIHYFRKDNFITIIVMLMIILLIGLNILRVYKDYILVQDSKNKVFDDFESMLSVNGSITFAIEGNELYPMLEILVNGEVIDKFDKNNKVTINVADRDIIQINGSMYSDDIIVSIEDTSSNIIDYLNNKQVIVKKNISTLAIIRI